MLLSIVSYNFFSFFWLKAYSRWKNDSSIEIIHELSHFFISSKGRSASQKGGTSWIETSTNQKEKMSGKYGGRVRISHPIISRVSLTVENVFFVCFGIFWSFYFEFQVLLLQLMVTVPNTGFTMFQQLILDHTLLFPSNTEQSNDLCC